METEEAKMEVANGVVRSWAQWMSRDDGWQTVGRSVLSLQTLL